MEKRRNRSLELLPSVWSTLAVGKHHDKGSFAQKRPKIDCHGIEIANYTEHDNYVKSAS